jgi:hypothetical protein
LFPIRTAIIILFIPETAYKRDSIYNIDINSIEHLGELATKEAQAGGEKEPEQIETVAGQQTQSVSPAVPDKKSYLQMLKPWSGIRHEEITIKTFLGPLKHVINPAVLWVRPLNAHLSGSS